MKEFGEDCLDRSNLWFKKKLEIMKEIGEDYLDLPRSNLCFQEKLQVLKEIGEDYLDLTCGSRRSWRL